MRLAHHQISAIIELAHQLHVAVCDEETTTTAATKVPQRNLLRGTVIIMGDTGATASELDQHPFDEG